MSDKHCYEIWKYTWPEVVKMAFDGYVLSSIDGRLLAGNGKPLKEIDAYPEYCKSVSRAIARKHPVPPHIVQQYNERVARYDAGDKSAHFTPTKEAIPVTAETRPLNTKGKPFTWSFSAISDFENCPAAYAAKRFFFTHKDDQDSEHLVWGNRVHKACEMAIKHNAAIPQDILQALPNIQKYIDMFLRAKAAGYQVFAEEQITLRPDMGLTSWFGSDAWGRCALDVSLITPDGKTLNMYDWKTGKQKDNLFQLEVCAAMASLRWPEVELFIPKFIWLKPEFDSVTPADVVITKQQIPAIWEKIFSKLNRMQEAWKSKNFPERSSGLCGWCVKGKAGDCIYGR